MSAALIRRLDAAAGNRVERLDLAQRHAFGLGILDDRLGQWVLAGTLGTGGEVEERQAR